MWGCSSSLRSGILPLFSMGEYLLFSDESGDLGIDLRKKGTSRTYVPFLIFLNRNHRDEFYSIFKSNFKKYAKIDVKKWKKLPSKIKKSDRILSSILFYFHQDIQEAEKKAKELFFLLTTTILDKSEITKQKTPRLYSLRSYRMAWAYGLAFKRIGIYLAKMQDTALWIIDQNSTIEMRNLKRYILDILPDSNNFLRRYEEPKFGSSSDKRYLKVVDFFAGLTRVSIENIIDNCHKHLECKKINENCFLNCNFINYKLTINSLFGLFNFQIIQKNIPKWQWRGFLFWPPEKRRKYSHVFPPDEYIK
jgi:hypothetical protein